MKQFFGYRALRVGGWAISAACVAEASYIIAPGTYLGNPEDTAMCDDGTDCSKWPVDNRHLEGANYAFFDGHVKWLGIKHLENGTPNGVDISTAYGASGTGVGGYPALYWPDSSNDKVKPFWAPHL